ncbi:hypothetical protein [Streptomyces sp. col6]|uniref:hypothetical protein n=1 Tax=Streptomyces sp. col6 TaxID=2478958 RepID=UPI0011CE3501|nr:hypothetical protein [Streptomyces sp. col6]
MFRDYAPQRHRPAQGLPAVGQRHTQLERRHGGAPILRIRFSTDQVRQNPPGPAMSGYAYVIFSLKEGDIEELRDHRVVRSPSSDAEQLPVQRLAISSSNAHKAPHTQAAAAGVL